MAAALFERDDVEGPVRDKVLEMEGRWRGFLRQLIAEAIHAGHLRRGLDVEQFAWELCGIYLSHHVAQRFLRDAHADRRANTAFQALLEQAGAASRKRRQPREPRQRSRSGRL